MIFGFVVVQVSLYADDTLLYQTVNNTHFVSMKANECLQMPVQITSKEKPQVSMQSVQSYLLFAIVTNELK